MRESARIAARAHVRAMRFCRPGLHEYQVMAEILHEFMRSRADISYQPIVGGGENGCILHYTENSAVLNDGELLLIDAGCEYEYYASDITRTWSAGAAVCGSGRWTATRPVGNSGDTLTPYLTPGRSGDRTPPGGPPARRP
jgi:Xaa-Pro aminopeptidase